MSWGLAFTSGPPPLASPLPAEPRQPVIISRVLSAQPEMHAKSAIAPVGNGSAKRIVLLVVMSASR